MSTSIFYDPPIRAKRVYAGEVRVVDDIKFWDKATKVVNSRIHGDDGNLNIVVENSNKEVNFFTDQITFHDHDGTQLGYIDSSGVIHGLSVDGHATNVDISDLEDDIDSNAARISTLETNLSSNASRISTLETNANDISSLEDDIDSNAARVSTLETNLSSNAARVGTLETNLSSNASRVSTLETDLSSNAARVGTLETDLSSNATRVGTLETDLSSNATRVGTLETDLSSNASRVSTLETDLSSNASRVSIIETDLSSNASRVSILEGNVETIESNILILHGNVETLSSNIDILHGNVETIESNISILHGNVETLESNVDILHDNVEVIMSNLFYRIHVGNNPQTGESSGPLSNIANLYTLVTTIEDDLESNASRIDTIESNYVTSSDLSDSQATSTALGATFGGFFGAATSFFTTSSGASRTLSDFFEQLADVHDDDEDFTMQNVVQKPSDWSSYPPTGGGATTLKSYVEQKAAYEVQEFADGDFATLDASVSTLSTAVTNLNTELDSNATRIGTLETTTSTLDQSVSDLSTAVTNLNTELDSNAARVGTLESTTSTLDQSVSDLSTAVTTLTTDHESNVTRIENLEGSTGVTGLGDRVSVIESNIYFSYDGLDTNNVHALHGRVEELESNIFWSSSYVDGNGDTVTLTGNVHVLNGVVEDLNDELDSNAARVSTLETDLTDNAARVSTLETDLTDNAARVSTLETDLTNNVSRIETLETDLTNNVSRIQTLEDAGSLWTENATNDIYYNDGNVGIGTTSPQGQLHVSSGTSGDCVMILEADTDNNNEEDNPRIEFWQDGSLKESAITQGDNKLNLMNSVITGGGILFHTGTTNGYTNAAERMRIQPTGNVGIGMNTPSVKLHLKTDWATNDYDGLYIRSNHGQDYVQLGSSTSDQYGGSAGYLRLHNQMGNANGGVLLDGAGDSHINGGKLGVGVTYPKAPLHVEANDCVLAISDDTPDCDVNGFNCALLFTDGTWDGSGGFSGNPANGMAFRLGHMSSGNKEINMRNLTGELTFGTRNNYRAISINNSGLVGIQNNTPYFPLHVLGNAGGQNTGSRRYFRYDIATTDTSYGSGGTIFSAGAIITNSYFISTSGAANSSDRRIKTDITDIDDGEALDILRLIKPKRYCYKDTISRGSTPVYGFIAQEVRETLPHATLLQNDFIPNIYELSNVSQSNVITFTNFTTTQLNNHTSKIKLMEADGGETYANIVEVIDDHTIRVDEDLTEKMASVDETGEVVSGNQIFVYGEEVDDFVFLKKEAIFTIATAAVQEVDRQLQQEKAKVADLLGKVADLLARVEALESNLSS